MDGCTTSAQVLIASAGTPFPGAMNTCSLEGLGSGVNQLCAGVVCAGVIACPHTLRSKSCS